MRRLYCRFSKYRPRYDSLPCLSFPSNSLQRVRESADGASAGSEAVDALAGSRWEFCKDVGA